MEFLYHYYEKSRGPFRNLSDLPSYRADEVLAQLKSGGDSFASQRDEGYMDRRRELEALARKRFVEKGGFPVRRNPHYMVVGPCKWLASWYKNSAFVRIHISEFDVNALSFTYGDMFPTFSARAIDEKEYRREIYTYKEILEVIRRYGLPQIWNEHGRLGPERYVEVQVWTDEPADQFRLGLRTE